MQKFRNLTAVEEDFFISTFKRKPDTGFLGGAAGQNSDCFPRPGGRQSVKMPRGTARLCRFHPFRFQPPLVVKASKDGIQGARLDACSLAQIVPVTPRASAFLEGTKNRDGLWGDTHGTSLYI